jgi:hypothetical protein
MVSKTINIIVLKDKVWKYKGVDITPETLLGSDVLDTEFRQVKCL